MSLKYKLSSGPLHIFAKQLLPQPLGHDASKALLAGGVDLATEHSSHVVCLSVMKARAYISLLPPPLPLSIFFTGSFSLSHTHTHTHCQRPLVTARGLLPVGVGEHKAAM